MRCLTELISSMWGTLFCYPYMLLGVQFVISSATWTAYKKGCSRSQRELRVVRARPKYYANAGVWSYAEEHSLLFTYNSSFLYLTLLFYSHIRRAQRKGAFCYGSRIQPPSTALLKKVQANTAQIFLMYPNLHALELFANPYHAASLIDEAIRAVWAYCLKSRFHRWTCNQHLILTNN